MSAPSVPASRVLWLLAGFIVWSAAFGALYAALSIGCAFRWHEIPLAGPLTVQRAVLIALFAASLAAGAVVLRIADRRRRMARGSQQPLGPFMETAAWLAAFAALGSTVLSLGPVFFLTACY